MNEDKTDKNKQNQEIAEKRSDAPAPAEKTAGEKIHNEITYRGVDFLANTAFAVSFACWANRTNAGKVWYAKPAQNFFKGAFRPVCRDPKLLDKWAERGATFASIVIGGTAIIPPMIVLDRNKRSMVEWMDRKIYGDAEVENNDRFAIRYEAIENGPKKGFWTGMGARILVLAPMLAAHTVYEDSMNKWIYQPIAWTSKKATKFMNIQPRKMMERRYNGPKDVTDWDYMHTVLGMDASLTFAYSYAHEWMYKGLTNLFHRRREGAAEPEQPTAHIEAKNSEMQHTIKQPDEVALNHG